MLIKIYWIFKSIKCDIHVKVLFRHLICIVRNNVPFFLLFYEFFFFFLIFIIIFLFYILHTVSNKQIYVILSGINNRFWKPNFSKMTSKHHKIIQSLHCYEHFFCHFFFSKVNTIYFYFIFELYFLLCYDIISLIKMIFYFSDVILYSHIFLTV